MKYHSLPRMGTVKDIASRIGRVIHRRTNCLIIARGTPTIFGLPTPNLANYTILEISRAVTQCADELDQQRPYHVPGVML